MWLGISMCLEGDHSSLTANIHVCIHVGYLVLFIYICALKVMK